MADFQTDMKKGLQVFRGMEWWLKGVWILAVIAVAVVLGLFVMPSVILAFENLWIAGMWFGLTALAAYLAFNQKLRTTFIYAIDNTCLWLRNLLADSEPFLTAQTAISRIKKRWNELGTAVGKLRGKKKTADQKTAALEKQLLGAKGAFTYAQKQNDQRNMRVEASRGQSLREALDQIRPQQQSLEQMILMMSKTYEFLGEKIEIQENDLNAKLEAYDIASIQSGAVKDAKKMMSGEDQEMFDRSMKNIADQTNAMLGEVEQFLDVTQPLIDSADFRKQAKAMAALEEFQKWASVDGEIISSTEKQQLLLTAGAETQFVPAVQAAITQDEYQLIPRK